MISTWLVEHRWATTAGLVALVLLGPVVGTWLAGRPRAARWLAALSLLPLAVLTSSPAPQRGREAWCTVQWALPGLGSVELVANVLLFAVPALLAMVGGRRPGTTLLGGMLLSAGIELVQAAVPVLGRACDTNDWVCNSAGAVLGVALGWVALRAAGRGTGRARRAAAPAGPRRGGR